MLTKAKHRTPPRTWIRKEMLVSKKLKLMEDIQQSIRTWVDSSSKFNLKPQDNSRIDDTQGSMA